MMELRLMTSEDWQARHDLLGTKPDRELAALWGVPIAQVKKRRERLGIKACKQIYVAGPTTWTAEQDALLGTMPDTLAAIALGNVDPKIVKSRRKELGIPSLADQISARKRQEEDKAFEEMNWPPELISELGKRFDHYLAGRFGIPEWMLRRKRESLGIKEEPFSHLYESKPPC